METRTRRRTAVVMMMTTSAVVGAILIVLTSCRDATQVSISARTNVAFREGLVTSFVVGVGPAIVETAPPKATSREPWGADGFIASLTVVPPNDDDSGELAVKIVMGIHRDIRECLPPKYDGCIVARRLVHYVDHSAISLPVTLWARCEGVPCDKDTTCNALGDCVTSSVPSCEDGCNVTGDEGVPIVGVEAGVLDRDGGGDGGDADSSSFSDADAVAKDDANDPDGDSGNVFAEGGTPGKIDCNLTNIASPPATTCDPTFQYCCNHGYVGTIPSLHCTNQELGQAVCTNEASGSLLLYCDGNEDCPSENRCCYDQDQAFVCVPGQCPLGTNEVCHSSGHCSLPNQTCGQIKAYGYYEICAAK